MTHPQFPQPSALKVGDRVADLQGKRGTVVLIGGISLLPHILWDGEIEPKMWPYIILTPIKVSERASLSRD